MRFISSDDGGLYPNLTVSQSYFIFPTDLFLKRTSKINSSLCVSFVFEVSVIIGICLFAYFQNLGHHRNLSVCLFSKSRSS